MDGARAGTAGSVGTAFAAYVSFAEQVGTVLLTQVELSGPSLPAVMQDFLTAARP